MLDFPKLRWAHDQLEALHAYGQDWFAGDHHRITSEPDESGLTGRRRNTAFHVDVDPIPLEFSLRVGDVLQGFRSGLDHLAYALAVAHTGDPLPDPIAVASEFPIFGDDSRAGNSGTGSARFHQVSRAGVPASASGLAKMQGIDPAAQAIIESVQPYHRGPDFRDDPLWRLHELSRIDKHRLVHVVAAAFNGVAMVMHPDSNYRVGPGQLISNTAVVEGRTLVGSIPVEAIDPKKSVRVEVTTLLKPAFGLSVPLVAGEPVIAMLGAIDKHIYDRVLKPLVGYLLPPDEAGLA
jgi:hypothetical protein